MINNNNAEEMPISLTIFLDSSDSLNFAITISYCATENNYYT